MLFDEVTTSAPTRISCPATLWLRGLSPPSAAQRQLWFLDQLNGPGVAYNVEFSVRLIGPLDVVVLRQRVRPRHPHAVPTGKVDRARLSEPVLAAKGHEPPAEDMECRVVGIWQEVLVVPGIGVHDNFFRLGGHALLVLQVVFRVARRWVRIVPPDWRSATYLPCGSSPSDCAPLDHPPRRTLVFEADDDTRTYRVVVNHEEQYSIWPEGRDLPAGWTDTGHSGPRADCLKHIAAVWTDLRPLSLRRSMAADGG